MVRRRFIAWPGREHLVRSIKVEAAVGALFVAVYAGADWVTGLHSVRVPIHFELELAIPFVPSATLLYSSLYLMLLLAPFVLRRKEEMDSAATAVTAQILVAGAAFVLIPSEPAYSPAAVELGSWRGAFLAADAVNLTYNMAPSLHVAFAATFGWLFATRSRGALRWAMALWGVAIAASTLLTHQHHVVDVAAGAVLAAATLVWTARRHAPESDAELRERASQLLPGTAFEDLTSERLARVAREHGLDVATALLAERVVAASPSHEFVAAVDATRLRERLPQIDARLLVAPAAFFREKPSFGGDGRLVRDVAARFGIGSDLLPVSSTGTVRENASRIADALAARRRDEPIVLVSLSKGAADLRMALESLGDDQPRALVWLQICGLARGSAYADIALDSRVTRALMKLYLGRHGVDLSLVEELRASRGPLSSPFLPPPGLFVVNILGFPRENHMSWASRRRRHAMAELGPSDGATVLRDAIVEPGVVYPVWGADHYFRVGGAEALLMKIFCHLVESGRLPEARR